LDLVECRHRLFTLRAVRACIVNSFDDIQCYRYFQSTEAVTPIRFGHARIDKNELLIGLLLPPSGSLHFPMNFFRRLLLIFVYLMMRSDEMKQQRTDTSAVNMSDAHR
jgi:hypothetical protein